MPTDLITSVIIIGVSALILHLKSHLKFIVLGLYIGIVLAETVAEGTYSYLSARWAWFENPNGQNILQLLLLLIPTVILGINHSGEKKKWSLTKSLAYVVLTTFLLLAG